MLTFMPSDARPILFEFANPITDTDGVRVLAVPVNCVGVMGAGLAKAVLAAYPRESAKYRLACSVFPRHSSMRPGELLCVPCVDDDRYRLWFVATKYHWKNPSYLYDVERCIVEVRNAAQLLWQSYPDLTILLPALGCGCGGLDPRLVRQRVENILAAEDAHFKVYGLHKRRSS